MCGDPTAIFVGLHITFDHNVDQFPLSCSSPHFAALSFDMEIETSGCTPLSVKHAHIFVPCGNTVALLFMSHTARESHRVCGEGNVTAEGVSIYRRKAIQTNYPFLYVYLISVKP